MELKGNKMVFVLMKERASVRPNFLRNIGEGSSISQPQRDQTIYSQGDPAASIFYIVRGKVKVTFAICDATARSATNFTVKS